MDDLIPVEKLAANLNNRDPSRKAVVLVTTGSLCPVHQMHVSVFDIAKAHLEKSQALQVVGGFLSPSHDYYVSGKLGKRDAIAATHRLAMCRLALDSHPFVSCSAWEAEQPGFVDFPGVTGFHRDHLRERFPNEQLEVMYLCGADHAVRCGLTNGMGGIPVVCISRPGSEKRLAGVGSRTGLFYLVENGIDVARADASSTEVRRRLKSGEPIDGLVHAPVAEYLYAHIAKSASKR